MIPKSLSASALQIATVCPARYKAEYIDKVRGPSNPAAELGTVVHAALEEYVKSIYLEQTQPEPSWTYLLNLYCKYYEEMYGKKTINTDQYKDGRNMLDSWYRRSDYIDEGEVLSCEIKESFDLPTSAGAIPVNYIWDRSDRLSPGEYRIVDYKTIRVPLQPDLLRTKIQPRIYALAAQIKFQDADKIWVEFDQIRHDRIGLVFNREDNIATWKWLKLQAEKLIALDDPPPAHVNEDCRYCSIRQGCKELLRVSMSGMVIPGLSIAQIAKRHADLTAASKALELNVKELDKVLIEHAEKNDVFNWNEDDLTVKINARQTRSVDAERAAKVIGPELMKQYGKLNMSAVDALLKGTELTEAQKKELTDLIYKSWGDPHAKVTLKNEIDKL